MLDKLSPQWRKYISNRIEKKLISAGIGAENIRYLEYIDYANIIKPYFILDSYLTEVKNLGEIMRIMNFFFYEPDRISEQVIFIPSSSHWEKKNLERRTRQLAKLLCKIGLLDYIVVGPDLHGIPYNARLWNASIYFVPNYHTKEEIQKAIDKYARLAGPEGVGWINDRIDPKEKIKEKEELIQTKLPDNVYAICYSCNKEIFKGHSTRMEVIQGKKIFYHKKCKEGV